MILKQVEIYPPDWHGARELDYIPRHFTHVPATQSPNKEVRGWIQKHTRGRYAFGIALVEAQGVQITRATLAFEDPAEATLFALGYVEPEDILSF